MSLSSFVTLFIILDPIECTARIRGLAISVGSYIIRYAPYGKLRSMMGRKGLTAAKNPEEFNKVTREIGHYNSSRGLYIMASHHSCCVSYFLYTTGETYSLKLKF